MSDLTAGVARVAAAIEPVSDLLQRGVRAVLGALPQEARDALDGTWLGAPLHPALTDVPIGASAVAVMADAARVVSGADSLDAAADTALAVAVLAAVPAAATGVNDWSHLRGEPKRVGTVHALLNSVALVLNCLSLLARRRGDRGRGRLLSALRLRRRLARGAPRRPAQLRPRHPRRPHRVRVAARRVRRRPRRGRAAGDGRARGRGRRRRRPAVAGRRPRLRDRRDVHAPRRAARRRRARGRRDRLPVARLALRPLQRRA